MNAVPGLSLLTIGHSMRTSGAMVTQLEAQGMAPLIDIRGFSGSQRRLWFGSDAPKTKLVDASPGSGWRNASFPALTGEDGSLGPTAGSATSCPPSTGRCYSARAGEYMPTVGCGPRPIAA